MKFKNAVNSKLSALSSLSRPRWTGTALLFAFAFAGNALSRDTWDGGSVSTTLQASGQALPLSLYAYTSAGDILGGERDVQYDLSSINGTVTGASSSNFAQVGYDSAFYGGNYLDTARSSGVTGAATFVWDGVDGSSDIDYTGLGGVNLTNLYDGIQFNIARDTNPGSWEFRFYTDQHHFSNYTVTFPAENVGFPGTHYEVLFANMNPVGSLGGADFSNIGAIVVVGDSPNSLDSAILNYGFTAVPEPNTAILGLSAVALLARRSRRVNRQDAD